MNDILTENDTKAVMDILVEHLEVGKQQLTPEAKLQGDLGADSLTLIEIALALEEHFKISIPDEEWENVSTVGDVFEGLTQVLSKANR